MRDVLTVAAFTFRRYMKKPIAIVIFLFAPALLFVMVTGSSMASFAADFKDLPGSSCLKNSFLPPAGGLSVTDRECIVFLLMCLFYFAILSCQTLTGDLKNGVRARMQAAPVSPFKSVLGKSLGSLTLLYGFSLTNLLLGKFVFGISFGSNSVITAAALFLFCVVVNSFGILISGFMRNIYLCCVFVFCCNFPMMFVVMYKIFSPLDISQFAILTAVSMHNYAYTSIVGASWSALLPLLAIAAVITPLSLLVGRRVLK